MIWSPQQDAALVAVDRWLKDPHGKQVFRLFGFAGTGKALPDTAPVLTPRGFVPMGALEVGMSVIGGNGLPCQIQGVFPQGARQCYRLTFNDGTTAECDAEHLWTVKDGSGANTKWKTLTCAAMRANLVFANGRPRYALPVLPPVDFQDYSGDHPLHPYVLGVILGDGSTSGNIMVHKPERDILDRVASLLPAEDVLSIEEGRGRYARIKRRTKNNEISATKRYLLEMGLVGKEAHEKFIPTAYLRGPVRSRMALLQGLLDTDGFVQSGSVEYTSSSEQLAKDVVFLARSLGAIVAVTDRIPTYRYKNEKKKGRRSWRCLIRMTNDWVPVTSRKHVAKYKYSQRSTKDRRILAIEPTTIQDCTCIKVAAADGLFVAYDFAVTHNTTLAQHFAADVKGLVLFGAFTGKAAHVLKQKGCPGAQTIHSMIYTSAEKSRKRLHEIQEQLLSVRSEPGAIGGSRERLRLERELAEERKRLNQPSFSLAKSKDIERAELVIIDEVSMCDERLGRDLLSFGRRVLVLGDPFQLPPVYGSGGFFTEQQPDILLTEIHRQALDSPVLVMATRVRLGEQLNTGWFSGQSCVTDEISPEEVMACDQVIVGKNETRRASNNRIRQLLGRANQRPVPGDKLVCLRNNHDKGLLNGSIWSVLSLNDQTEDQLEMTIQSDTADGPMEVTSWSHAFFGHEMDLPWFERKDAEEFDYGYTLTCHKAQGSQFDNVILFDESYISRQHRARWLYTGITRAAQSIKVVRRAA